MPKSSAANGNWAHARAAYANELTSLIVRLSALAGPGHDTKEIADYLANPHLSKPGLRAQLELKYGGNR